MARFRLPLLVGTAVVLLAGILAFATRPADRGADDPAPGAVPDAAGDADRLRLGRLVGAGDDVSRLRALHSEFIEEERLDWASAVLDRILSLSPQDDWANERAGREDLREVYAKIPRVPDLELYPDLAFERLDALRKAGIRWGTTKDRGYVEELVGETTAHAVRLRGDPVYRDEWVWRTWMSRHPVFKDLRFVSLYRPPYLVFAEVGQAGEEQARLALDRVASLLSHACDRFRGLFAGRFDLPPLADEARGELRVAKALVFSDERTYRGYQALIRDPVHRGAEGHYVFEDQWIVLHEEGRDPGATVRFTGVTQLLHFYRKICVERDAGEVVPWRDPRLDCRLPWFETGFVRFLAADEGVDPALLEVFREDPGGIEDVLSADRSDLRRDWTPSSADPLLSLTARSWAFSHFLWHFDEGRYRERLVAYLGEELHGRSGPEVFTRVFWGDAAPDWPALEAEWKLHMSRLAK